MYEIEVKILEIDVEKLIEKLKRLGARLVFDGIVESYIFIIKRNPKIILRLRKMGDKEVITYKRVLKEKSVKISEEYECFIYEEGKLKDILDKIGIKTFKVFNSIEGLKSFLEKRGIKFEIYNLKRRTSFSYNGVKLEIDRIIKDNNIEDQIEIPPYLEIEIKARDEREAENTINKIIDELDLKEKERFEGDTGALIKYYLSRSISKN